MKKNVLHINGFGTKCWYKSGKYHRDDGPAVIYPDGRQEWYKEGKWHRDDGPAVIYPNGVQRWYKDDQPYEPSAHELMAWKMNEKERTTC